MKLLKRLCCFILVSCTVLCLVLPAGAYPLIYTESELKDAYLPYCSRENTSNMTVDQDFISYIGTDFRNSIYNIGYSFLSVPYLLEVKQPNFGTDDIYSISINHSHSIEVSDVTVTDTNGGECSPVLTFTYDISGCKPDPSKNISVLALYKEIGDHDPDGADTSGNMTGNIVGRQYIEYFPAGTEFDVKGRCASVVLPKNFDPSKFAVGITVWQTDVAPFDYARKGGYTYMVSPATESSPVKVLDLSEQTADFEAWTPSSSDGIYLSNRDFRSPLSDDAAAQIGALLADAKSRDDCGRISVDTAIVANKYIATILPCVYGTYYSGGTAQMTDRSPYTQIYLAMVEKETSKAVTYCQFDEFFPNDLFALPDGFLPEVHEFVIFEYSNIGHVSRICTVDPLNYIYGDVDKNGKLNLLDATTMLKKIAGWESIEIDRTLLSDGRKNTDLNKSGYTLSKVATVLKLIAGWPIEELYSRIESSIPLLCELSGLTYRYTNEQ